MYLFLLVKYYIHKCTFSSTSPKLHRFLCDCNYLIYTKKSVTFVKLYNDLLNVLLYYLCTSLFYYFSLFFSYIIFLYVNIRIFIFFSLPIYYFCIYK